MFVHFFELSSSAKPDSSKSYLYHPHFSNHPTSQSSVKPDSSKKMFESGRRTFLTTRLRRAFSNCPVSRNFRTVWLHGAFRTVRLCTVFFKERIIWSGFAVSFSEKQVEFFGMDFCHKVRSNYTLVKRLGMCFSLSSSAKLCETGRFEMFCEFGWFGKCQ